MGWHSLICAALCACALVYLAVANATGYVPFVTSTQHGTGATTAGQFHK